MSAYSDQIVRHLDHLYHVDERRHAFRGSTPEKFSAWSSAARPALRTLVGLERIRESIRAFQTGVSLGETEDLGDCTRQAGVLHAEPHFDVPFYYLRPKTAGPHPLALFPHGHYQERGFEITAGIARDAEEAAYIAAEDRDVAVQAAHLGFAAIAPATRGFLPAVIPDLTGRHNNRNCHSELIHALLVGRTVIGERVWDLERLIDWATGQPDVDASSVLMIGNSGGGVATLYAAACDTRVTTAVVSCSFCSFVGETGFVHHCDCNLVPGMMQFGEAWDIAGLIAPRRLLVVHGAQDPLFPFPEIDRAVDATRGVFAAAGVPDAFAHRWGEGGHRFYRDLMWPFVQEGFPADRSPA